MKKVGIYGIIIVALWCAQGEAASERSMVKEANQLFDGENYGQAIEKYNEAMVHAPNSAIIHFNTGAAYYKKGDLKRAINAFTQALVTDDSQLEAQANYNIANARYRLGQKAEQTDSNAAIEQVRDALAYYKRAMELDGSDTDAKFNYEFVEQELERMQEQAKKQPQQKQENQKQQKKQEKQEEQQGGQQQQSKQSQEQDKSSQEQQSQKDEEQQEKQQAQAEEKKEQDNKETEQEQQSSSEKKDEKDQEDGQAKQAARGEEGEDGEEEGDAEEGNEMSEEEARMILEGFRQQEETGSLFQQQEKRKKRPRRAKNW